MKKLNPYSFLLMASLFMIFSMDSFATLYNITVKNYVFTPSNLPGVKIGDTLHWVWVNGMHTTTSTSIPAGATAWDSPIDTTHQTYDYIPKVAGDYHYQCSYDVGLGMIGLFTVLNNAGISDNILVPVITVYPDPVKDRIFFRCTTLEGVYIQHLAIYDRIGKVIREETFKDRNAFPEYMDLTGIPDGLMVFEFTDNLNRSYIRRAVRKE